MTRSAEFREYQELLTAMISELRTNQAALDELVNPYSVFLFTGGDVPRRKCDFAAINSYAERPFATERISTEDAEHYGHLIERLMALGKGAATQRPRALRCRHDIADSFSRVSSEIRALGSKLESALTELSKEQEQSLPGLVKLIGAARRNAVDEACVRHYLGPL